MTQSGQEGGGQTARNLYAARGRGRYRVATKHIVSLENRFPSLFCAGSNRCEQGLPAFAARSRGSIGRPAMRMVSRGAE